MMTGVFTMNVTNVLNVAAVMVGNVTAVLALGTTTVLVLFSFFHDVRTSTRVNFLRCLILNNDTASFMSGTGVLVLMHAVVMTFVTLHGSLLRSCSTE
jgi:hypothetical protein